MTEFDMLDLDETENEDFEDVTEQLLNGTLDEELDDEDFVDLAPLYVQDEANVGLIAV